MRVKCPIGVALGEREVLAVRVSQAHVALGEIEGIARAAAVESLIRRPAHALARHLARNGIGAVGRWCRLRRTGADTARRALMIFGLAKPMATW